ncbi:MAG: hypothetical protein CXZ00_07780 [Acidobacteria bacterium]|nr:MAG: hypothetical protein CXZ00_07780 [Acidobacteriota bacterium]
MAVSELDDLDNIEEELNEFEIDIRCLVSENHQITLDGIQRLEDEVIDDLTKTFANEEDELRNSEVRHAGAYFDDLRRAANHTALVSLVTRLDHWTRKFYKQLPTDFKRNEKNKESSMVRRMKVLNASLLATAPIPIKFFEELEAARDAVIHHDSQARWKYKGKDFYVADSYTKYGELNFTEQNLCTAIENVLAQVKWYDEQIASSRWRNSGNHSE